MARQLVFTSAPQGLTPGRTGFCTVARHRDLRERLVPVLESLSVFPSDWQPAPVICSFRIVELAGSRIPVLTRIVDAGHDYTHRTNFIAHHLILDPGEIAGAPAPAEIFLRWPGWLNRWDGQPRWFDDADNVNLSVLPTASAALPAATWRKLTGDAGRAALLVEDTQAAACVLRCAQANENDLLPLLRESSALLTPAESWRTAFTTCAQATDVAGAFRWAGVRADSDADTAALTRTGGKLLDLTRPDMLPPAPNNAAAKLAGDGIRGPRASAPVVPNPAILRNAPVAKSKTATPFAPMAAATPRATPLRAPVAPRSNFWLYVAAAALAILGGGALIWWGAGSEKIPPVSPVNNPAPAPNATANLNTPPMTQSANAAIANEQLLQSMEQLANAEKFLAALDQWKDLEKSDAEFAHTHVDFLKSRLLPGAQQEWHVQLDSIVHRLNEGTADRAALAVELEKLREFPHAWPLGDPAALEHDGDSVAAIFSFLDHLPAAPMGAEEDLTPADAGLDYQNFSGNISSAELRGLMNGTMAGYHVSCAPATSIVPPPPEKWFPFDVRPADFSAGNYLVLHDSSRGAAGGRFLEIMADTSGIFHLTWRVFKPDSEFFQSYPGNAPLRAIGAALWLHFAADAPRPSFYLLVRRANADTNSPWQPVTAPLAWLASEGAPARVSLPGWLTKNWPWHLSAGQSFRLAPTGNVAALKIITSLPEPTPAVTLDQVQFATASLINQLQQQARKQQTDLARAQGHLSDLHGLADNAPAGEKPLQAIVDQAQQTVENLQKQINDAQTAAQDATQPEWTRAAAPWTLFLVRASGPPLPILEFTPDETGPTR